MKTAAYCGTRNLYSDMVTAAKSLSVNSSVDRIYFIIEDDEFPYDLPDYVECINVSNQKYFNKRGPNANSFWTWMVLMRAAYTKIFPNLDKILSLDVDTIVNQNIDELWDLSLDGYFLAGVLEPEKSEPDVPYVNMGVTMHNLKLLRETGTDDRIIYFLNKQKFDFCEQDCINRVCKRNILTIPSIYNATKYTGLPFNPKIRHYAAEANWNIRELVRRYRDISWR